MQAVAAGAGLGGALGGLGTGGACGRGGAGARAGRAVWEAAVRKGQMRA